LYSYKYIYEYIIYRLFMVCITYIMCTYTHVLVFISLYFYKSNYNILIDEVFLLFNLNKYLKILLKTDIHTICNDNNNIMCMYSYIPGNKIYK